MYYETRKYYLNKETQEIRKENMKLKNGIVLITFDKETGRVNQNDMDPVFVSDEELQAKWVETKWEPKANTDKALRIAIEGFTINLIEVLFDLGIWEEEEEFFNDLWGSTDIVRNVLFEDEPHKGFRDFDQYFRTVVEREFPEDMADEIKMMDWDSLAFIRTAIKPEINRLINKVRQIDKGEENAL